MDRVVRGLLAVGLGLGFGVAPTVAGVTLVALGMASTPFVKGLMAELAGLFSVNLILSIAASPVIVLGLLEFRSGLRERAELLSKSNSNRQEIREPLA
ncbi:MAG: hypothetical protein RMJ28_01120 [Nitrososphaerota archaeon]|nr:hypothetical protein [Candidatus Calditenuaceae archaeon]MDW8072831.1 hypothetical protein [Nitrososphaerota archaeon]